MAPVHAATMSTQPSIANLFKKDKTVRGRSVRVACLHSLHTLDPVLSPSAHKSVGGLRRALLPLQDLPKVRADELPPAARIARLSTCIPQDLAHIGMSCDRSGHIEHQEDEEDHQEQERGGACSKTHRLPRSLRAAS